MSATWKLSDYMPLRNHTNIFFQDLSLDRSTRIHQHSRLTMPCMKQIECHKFANKRTGSLNSFQIKYLITVSKGAPSPGKKRAVVVESRNLTEPWQERKVLGYCSFIHLGFTGDPLGGLREDRNGNRGRPAQLL